VVTDPEAADFELVGTWYLQELSHYHLPCERRIVVDGEPPQPEYLLDHYTKNHWAAVFTPATLDTHDATAWPSTSRRSRSGPRGIAMA